MRGRPGRQGGAIGRGIESRLARDVGRGGHWRLFGRLRHLALGHAGRGQLIGREFRRQFVPEQLLFNGVGLGARHHAPVVDRARGARRDAVHAQIADVGLDHVVARIVRDGADRADRLAGVAADADLGVDQVLLDDGFGHGLFLSILADYSTSGTAASAGDQAAGYLLVRVPRPAASSLTSLRRTPQPPDPASCVDGPARQTAGVAAGYGRVP